MVTYYRVTGLSWAVGKLLVDVPFYSMVNLIAEQKVVPELIQSDMTGERIAAETASLLDNASERAKMKDGLARVAMLLADAGQMNKDPISRAADEVELLLGLKENLT